MLAEKFKNVKFILYDGAKFSNRLLKYSNVVIRNKYFGDDDIAEYKGKMDILISDVRLPLTADADANELQIHKDMMMQQDWVIKIKPRLGSMLKFRPPYVMFKFKDNGIPNSADYKYIGGTVYWQTFPHIQSTEGRLLSTAEDIEKGPVPFDYEHYEAAALQHNLRRVWCTYKPGTMYDNKFISMPQLISAIPGYDRCLDCSYFIFVLAEFIQKFEPYSSKNIIGFANYILKNTKALICTCEKTPSLENTDLYIHGLWQNMTRFQKHVKYTEMLTQSR